MREGLDVRRLVLYLGIVLLTLGGLRLSYLFFFGQEDTSSLPSPREVSVSLQISGRLQSQAEGEQIRLHFPDLPLNLDLPYSTDFAHTTELRADRKPERVVIQILSEGVVVAESPEYRLTGERTALGIVELNTLK